MLLRNFAPTPLPECGTCFTNGNSLRRSEGTESSLDEGEAFFGEN
jgi:hypothetical protein